MAGLLLLIWACGALLCGSLLFRLAHADREVPPWARALLFVVLTILWPVVMVWGLLRIAGRALVYLMSSPAEREAAKRRNRS